MFALTPIRYPAGNRAIRRLEKEEKNKIGGYQKLIEYQ